MRNFSLSLNKKAAPFCGTAFPNEAGSDSFRTRLSRIFNITDKPYFVKILFAPGGIRTLASFSVRDALYPLSYGGVLEQNIKCCWIVEYAKNVNLDRKVENFRRKEF